MFRKFNFGAVANGDIPAKTAVVAANPSPDNQMSDLDYSAKVAGDGEAVIGVSGITDTESGEVVEITAEGIVPVVAGEDLAIGDVVKSGEDGKAVKVAEGDLAFGVAMKAANKGEDVLVKLQ